VAAAPDAAEPPLQLRRLALAAVQQQQQQQQQQQRHHSRSGSVRARRAATAWVNGRPWPWTALRWRWLVQRQSPSSIAFSIANAHRDGGGVGAAAAAARAEADAEAAAGGDGERDAGAAGYGSGVSALGREAPLYLPGGPGAAPNATREGGDAPPSQAVAERAWSGPQCLLAFTVLVVGDGRNDKYAGPVFNEIARSMCGALQEMGHWCRVQVCPDLLVCPLQYRQLLVLGAHNLANYFEQRQGGSFVAWRIFPPETVLYNFEHMDMSGVNTNAGDVEFDLARLYGHFRVWEYSRQNLRVLRGQEGGNGPPHRHVSFVPLGHSGRAQLPVLATAAADEIDERRRGAGEGEDDIDVLFFGTMNPYRTQALAGLRAGGLQVYHANADGVALFGAALDALVARAKLVLSLRFWGTDAEWKVSRYAHLLRHGRLVVAEASGDRKELALFAGAIQFVEPSADAATTTARLLERCRRCLRLSAAARRTMAARGRALWLSERQAAAAWRGVEALQRARGCRRPVANTTLHFRRNEWDERGGGSGDDGGMRVVPVTLHSGDVLLEVALRLCRSASILASSAQCEGVAAALLGAAPYTPLLDAIAAADGGGATPGAGGGSEKMPAWATSPVLRSPLRLLGGSSGVSGFGEAEGEGRSALSAMLLLLGFRAAAWLGPPGRAAAQGGAAGGSLATLLLRDVDAVLLRLRRENATAGAALVIQGTSPRSASEAAMPRLGGWDSPPYAWTGDAWRAAMSIRARPDLDAATGDFDHGCTVVLVRPNSQPLRVVGGDGEASWQAMADSRKLALRLKSLYDLKSWLAERAPL
jgi:hypothetical protein